MIATPHGLIFRLPSGAAFLVLKKPGPCKRCKAQHYFFVNRGGSTLCATCDGGEPVAKTLERIGAATKAITKRPPKPRVSECCGAPIVKAPPPFESLICSACVNMTRPKR